jgi:hypothetical protein
MTRIWNDSVSSTGILHVGEVQQVSLLAHALRWRTQDGAGAGGLQAIAGSGADAPLHQQQPTTTDGTGTSTVCAHSKSNAASSKPLTAAAAEPLKSKKKKKKKKKGGAGTAAAAAAVQADALPFSTTSGAGNAINEFAETVTDRIRANTAGADGGTLPIYPDYDGCGGGGASAGWASASGISNTEDHVMLNAKKFQKAVQILSGNASNHAGVESMEMAVADMVDTLTMHSVTLMTS